MKQEEQRLRDEINYLLNHQKIDKSNYDLITSNWLGVISITISVIIGLSAIIIPLSIKDDTLSQLRLTILLITLLILLCLVKRRFEEFKNGRKEYSKNIVSTEEKIEERYAKIHGLEKGKFKEKLNDEFNKITT